MGVSLLQTNGNINFDNKVFLPGFLKPGQCQDYNAKWSGCGAHCQVECVDFDSGIKLKWWNHMPSKPCDKSCHSGCVCKDNYYKDKNGDCVRISECGSVKYAESQAMLKPGR